MGIKDNKWVGNTSNMFPYKSFRMTQKINLFMIWRMLRNKRECLQTKGHQALTLPFLYYLHQIIDKFTFTEIFQIKREGNVIELGRQSPFCTLAEIMYIGIEHQ